MDWCLDCCATVLRSDNWVVSLTPNVDADLRTATGFFCLGELVTERNADSFAVGMVLADCTYTWH